MLVKERQYIKTRVRGYTVHDEEKYIADRRQNAKMALGYLEKVVDKENLILDTFYQSLTNVMAGIQGTWENLRWYSQALGTSTTTPVRTDTGLNFELVRKQSTDFSPTLTNLTGRVVTMNTFFTSTDYCNASTTVSNATTPSTTQCSLTAVTGVPVSTAPDFAIGDLLRIQTPTMYEFRTITALAGNLITYAALSSSAPVVGATIAQCTEEAGFFGNLPASLTAGTVAINNGSAAVVGTGTAFLSSFIGDKVRFPSSTKPRTWFTILSITDNFHMTLSSNFTGANAGAASYAFQGTGFNHVNLLQYVKPPNKGFVFEDQWTPGG